MILVMQGRSGGHPGFVRGLTRQGHEVRVDDTTDLSSMSGVRSAVAEARPDAVVLMSEWGDIEACEGDEALAFERNAESAINVAAAALQFESVAVLLSTAEVFGHSGGPWSEADTPEPLSTYARSKLKGEQFLMRAAKSALVLRHGPLLDDGLPDLAARLRGDVDEADDEYVSPIGAEDLGRALHAVLQADLSGVVHAANAGAPVSRADLLRAAARALGVDPDRVRGTSGRQLERAARWARSPTLHTDRLARALKAPLRPWSAALEEAASAAPPAPSAPRTNPDVAGVEVFTPHPAAAEFGTHLEVARGPDHHADVLEMDVGKQVALRYHRTRLRTFHVLEGKVLLEERGAGDAEVDHVLRAGRSATVPPRVTYRLTAVDASRVLVVWAGGDDDTERV